MRDTEEGGAARTTVEPEGDRVRVVSPVDRLDEHIMEGSVGITCLEVPRVDAGVIELGVALNKVGITGILVIRSAAGAARIAEKHSKDSAILNIKRFIINKSMISHSIIYMFTTIGCCPCNL